MSYKQLHVALVLLAGCASTDLSEAVPSDEDLGPADDARAASCGWKRVTVDAPTIRTSDSPGYAGRSSSLAVDGEGGVHLGYVDSDIVGMK